MNWTMLIMLCVLRAAKKDNTVEKCCLFNFFVLFYGSQFSLICFSLDSFSCAVSL